MSPRFVVTLLTPGTLSTARTIWFSDVQNCELPETWTCPFSARTLKTEPGNSCEVSNTACTLAVSEILELLLGRNRVLILCELCCFDDETFWRLDIHLAQVDH
jgi:hypothetical protein